ncbi:MAG: heavy-metal-associated domain-containing protein [Eubacterium sp.]|nr:heavy-metal-associated domain-containing protein [Eubacterium sp.]
MKKTIVRIDGMMCGMCEAHICDVIRKTFSDAKKVSASRKKGEASVLTEKEPAESLLVEAITSMGYNYIYSESVEYKKKGLFGR